MEDDIANFTKRYIGDSYVKRWQERSSRKKKKLAIILEQGHLPDIGLSEADIEALLLQISSMDSNNWENSVGVGEREGRVLVDFIRRRHYGFTHGIGRSGDVTAVQPKASGSSLLCRLTNQLLLDWLKRSGSPSTSECFLVPMATGMSLTLCLMAMKRRRPRGASFVLWSRIDQKSCFKCMLAAGLVPIPIELVPDTSSDQLCSNIDALEIALKNPAKYLIDHWPNVAKAYHINTNSIENSTCDDIVCIFTTTNCFAPRVPDKLHAITKLCIKYGVSHLINNAYGVQSPRCMRMIESAGKLIIEHNLINASKTTSRPIDLLYVQSTDKNLMVPVGGAIIAGFCTDLVNSVAKLYPGRASATPTLDVFATLLYLGKKGWDDLLQHQSICFNRLHSGLKQISEKYNLKLLDTSSNPISLALSLENLLPVSMITQSIERNGNNVKSEIFRQLTQIGANLFTQGCSGVRVVLPASMQTSTKLDVYEFLGFNSHSSTSTIPYINAAAAIGQKDYEIDVFLQRLDKVIQHFQRVFRTKCTNKLSV
ncbi:O-phosphoseryl-tRNA(Sec) selenium transferase [Schistosoma japonicum]|uniref:O-phosphoseryl-tRNA(Sec) selenium transferase n=1 Tax=Schistosoma japonicum TaxID=6182 RepID=A0A4Z2DJF5_SCHJA|nr:O-phosphoseryl-tRNA(Sec) selenium transferase [Schistosoma japonicum]